MYQNVIFIPVFPVSRQSSVIGHHIARVAFLFFKLHRNERPRFILIFSGCICNLFAYGLSGLLWSRLGWDGMG